MIATYCINYNSVLYYSVYGNNWNFHWRSCLSTDQLILEHGSIILFKISSKSSPVRNDILPYISYISSNFESQMTSIADSEKTEIVYGTSNVLNIYSQMFKVIK